MSEIKTSMGVVNALVEWRQHDNENAMNELSNIIDAAEKVQREVCEQVIEDLTSDEVDVCTHCDGDGIEPQVFI